MAMHDDKSLCPPLPSLSTGDKTLDAAFRIALFQYPQSGSSNWNHSASASSEKRYQIHSHTSRDFTSGDIVGNVVPFADGLLEQERPVLLAGLDYNTPWTRDAAINTWNGAGLLLPEVTLNTLRSVLKRENGQLMIAGQYWDAIIWTIGAWWQYLYTGDKVFLAEAYEATRNSLAYFEQNEFNAELNLFRGPACYGDGVAAYPALYARANGSSSILDWPQANPEYVAKPGYGIPMHALSTNCLYYQAYVTLIAMAQELELMADRAWSPKAKALKQAINTHFWNVETQAYRYLVGPLGDCDHQEGMGNSFALLFGIANAERAAAILEKQHVTPQGIPCLWPNFRRYASADGMSFGRHSGTIWPHIQAFWGHAASLYQHHEQFLHELRTLAEHAVRDGQFYEIYHPVNGLPYGGVQEKDGEVVTWESCRHQTWSATGFVRLVLMGLLGMRFTPTGITIRPALPGSIEGVHLKGLSYRDASIDLRIEGGGTQVRECYVNGQQVNEAVVQTDATGEQHIRIVMQA